MSYTLIPLNATILDRSTSDKNLLRFGRIGKQCDRNTAVQNLIDITHGGRENWDLSNLVVSQPTKADEGKRPVQTVPIIVVGRVGSA
jgi:hypothetical protein